MIIISLYAVLKTSNTVMTNTFLAAMKAKATFQEEVAGEFPVLYL